jgi:amino acid transporter
MHGRFFTLITAMVVFLIVAFTPIVSIFLEFYGITEIFIHKTVVGLIVLASGWTFGKALLNREPKRKEGKLKLKPIFIIIGIVLIAICWYTELPTMIAEATGTNSLLEEQTTLPVGVRLWTSLITLVGVFLIKLGIYHQKEVYVMNNKSSKKEENGKSQIYNELVKMNEEY